MPNIQTQAGAKADFAPAGGPTPLHAAIAATCGGGAASTTTGVEGSPAAASASASGSGCLKPSLMLAVVDKLVAAGAPLAGKVGGRGGGAGAAGLGGGGGREGQGSGGLGPGEGACGRW